jgi:hypothetical protein
MDNSGSEDLWLFATGAVLNGGRWLQKFELPRAAFVPKLGCCITKSAKDGRPAYQRDGAELVHNEGGRLH